MTIKKVALLMSVLITTSVFYAQNLQIHYDMGKDRKYITTTLEMFKPDAYGNTFFFVDMDYNSNNAKGISLAYWEIARVIKTEKMPVGFHIEYNGGMLRGENFSAAINSAWLTGIDYSVNASDFSKGFTLKALYKHIVNKHDASFQLTGIWYYHFLNKKMTFNGFMDFWREDWQFGTDTTKFIFISEPQIWYHISNHFSVGGEIEITNNFGAVKGTKVNPTLGVKWTF